MTNLLDGILGDLLDACTSGLGAQGVTIPSGPGVIHGKPALDFSESDCDQFLAVYLANLAPRPFGERRPFMPGDLQVTGWQTIAACRVEYWTCSEGLDDTFNPPSDAKLNADAAARHAGVWAIWTAIGARRDADKLFPSLPIESPREWIGLGTLTPLGPQGLMAGWQINVEVALPRVFDAQPPGS